MLSQTIAYLDHYWHNLPEAILVLLITLLVTLALRFLLGRHHKQHAAHKYVWLSAALGALNAPLQIVVWFIGLSVVVDALTSGGRIPTLARVFPPARKVVMIAVVAWFLIRVIRAGTHSLHVRSASKTKGLDETGMDAINKMVSATIVTVAAMIAMQALGYSIASLLTFGGVAGIAVGFAARGIVANLLGGLTIYTSRPFSVGDAIIIPGTEIQGTVMSIGWRATLVMGWIGKPFHVPNAIFNTETLINHSHLVYRRISEYVYIRLEDIDKVPAIVRDVNAMLKVHPEMQHARSFFVFRFSSYDMNALKLYLYAFAKSTGYADFMAGQEDILLKIDGIITSHGARLAVPVSALYAPNGLQLHRASGPDTPPPEATAERPQSAHLVRP